MSTLRQSQLFNLSGRETHFEVLGTGPTILFVHGGPGFDHRYLVPQFEFLSEHYQLLFYDQPGCGSTTRSSNGESAYETIDHFCEVLEHLADREIAAIISHSWGGLLTIAGLSKLHKSLQQGESLRSKQVILINPIPMTAEKYLSGVQDLIQRFPGDLQARVGEMFATQGGGDLEMRDLLPYYVTCEVETIGASLGVDKKTYYEVSTTLGKLDVSNDLEFMPKLSLIRGTEDITHEHSIADIQEHAQNYVMENIGHFPFYERPDQFVEILQAILRVEQG